MVELRVFLFLEDPVDHRARAVSADGERRVDRVVDGVCAVAALEGAESEVVVPGDHAQLPVGLVQIVVVHHGAGIAVAVDEIVVHHEIAQQLVDVQHVLKVFPLAEGLQAADQPRPVGVGDGGFRVAEDVGIIVRVVVGILQLDVAAAHAHAAAEAAETAGGLAAEAAETAETAGRRGRISAAGHAGGIGGPAAHGAGLAAGGLRRIAACGAGLAAGGLRRIAACGAGFAAGLFRRHGRFRAPRALAAAPGEAHRLRVFVDEVLDVEVTAVAGTAAAHAQGVRLVEVALAAVDALHEAVLHGLDRQIQPPVFAVDRHPDIGAERRVGAELRHQAVGQVVLHIGVVLDEVVEAELVQALVGLAGLVVVELELEAVALGAHRGHRGQRGVALAADRDAFDRLIVDDHAARRVFLARRRLDEGVPVVDHDVDRVDTGGVEQRLFVAHRAGGGRETQRLAVHEEDRDQQGEQRDDNADPVDVFMR